MKNADKQAMPCMIEPTNAMRQSNAINGQGDPGPTYMPGITKREHFAALAMQGILCSSRYGETHMDVVAKESVYQADELLEALEAH